MKRNLILLFLCLSTLGYSQLRSLNIGTVADKDYLSVVRFEMMGDKLIVPVSIRGKNYRFLFDTGAPNIISRELDSILQPEAIGTIPTSDATGKRNKLKVVAVESLVFGDVEFKGTASLVYDLKESSIFECFNIDGFIGSNMLRKSIIQIDTKTKTMILTDNRRNLSLNKKEATKIRLTKNQSSPYIWIKLQGKESAREELLIDTGADDLYDLAHQHYAIFQQKNIFELKGEAKGASSISLFGDAPVNNQYQVLLPSLIVNGFAINNVVAETTNDNNSRIGASILQYGKMTIDFKGKRFYFTPHEVPFPVQRYEFGFSSTYLNDRLSIGFVWDEQLQSKMAYGDQILSINGIDITNDNLCDLVADKIDSRRQKVLRLTTKNTAGEVKEHVLTGTIYKSKN